MLWNTLVPPVIEALDARAVPCIVMPRLQGVDELVVAQIEFVIGRVDLHRPVDGRMLIVVPIAPFMPHPVVMCLGNIRRDTAGLFLMILPLPFCGVAGIDVLAAAAVWRRLTVDLRGIGDDVFALGQVWSLVLFGKAVLRQGHLASSLIPCKSRRPSIWNVCYIH